MHDFNALDDFVTPRTLTVRHDGAVQLWHLHALHDQDEAAALPAAAHPIAVSGIILDHPRRQAPDAL